MPFRCLNFGVHRGMPGRSKKALIKALLIKGFYSKVLMRCFVLKVPELKKSALYQSLRASAVPVPGRSGCYSVVSPRLQFLPLDSPLLPLARREMQVLGDAIAAAPGYAKLLMHMLNRREAVDSSQIEGTHTRFADSKPARKGVPHVKTKA